jgi:vesicle-fusing ATPase
MAWQAAAYLVLLHRHGCCCWAVADAAFTTSTHTSTSWVSRRFDDVDNVDPKGLPRPRGCRKRCPTNVKGVIRGTCSSPEESAAASFQGHAIRSLSLGGRGGFHCKERRRTRPLRAAGINGERVMDDDEEGAKNSQAAAVAASSSSSSIGRDLHVLQVDIGIGGRTSTPANQPDNRGGAERRSAPTSSSPTTAAAMSAFDLVAALAYRVIVESDRRRDAVAGKSTSAGSSATNWIDEQASFYLQKSLDKLELNDSGGGRDPQISARWTRWMKSVPCPAVWDVSSEFRHSIIQSLRLDADGSNSPVDDDSALNNNIYARRASQEELARQVLPRVGCRIILLPSGAELNAPLLEPTASLILGKLLFGGATRYRRLYASSSSSSTNAESSSSSMKAPPRKVGIRTEVMTKPSSSIPSGGSTNGDSASPPPPSPPSWCMFGGLERMYEAVDMGGCAILEVVVLPLGKVHDPTSSIEAFSLVSSAPSSPSPHLQNSQHPPPVDPTNARNNNLLMLNVPWKPADVLVLRPDPGIIDANNSQAKGRTLTSAAARNYDEMLDGAARNEAFAHDFSATVGGLRPQIDMIVRRVLDGRMIRPVDELGNSNANDNSGHISNDPTLALDAEELSALGLAPVRGLLLHGPPGTGKTLLAREISRALRARAPKIVSAPELLDRWVGGSEKAVRALFADAESELAACDNDPAKSALHVVVIDEIDAVFRHRSASANDSGEATRSSVVNQILAKLDGVNAIPNVLVIGMTNRRELLDDALLRPGRLEVQIEIPLPPREGRREILQIHFGPLRRKGRLSDPLCRAIDGVAAWPSAGSRWDESEAPKRKRDHLHLAWRKLSDRIIHASRHHIAPLTLSRHFDLADATRGYSGADLAGLVRCAGSIALSRARRDGTGVNGLFITLEDVRVALTEVKS